MNRITMAMGMISVTLSIANGAIAGPPIDGSCMGESEMQSRPGDRLSPLAGRLAACKGECPKPSYSPLHYWAPLIAKHEEKHGPKLSVYAPDRHPEITPNVAQIRYRCPAVPPGVTILDPPTPPPESRFRY